MKHTTGLEDLEAISEKITRFRVGMGMTQKEFADYMHVSQAMVSRWESKDYNFSVCTLHDIAKKLGCTFVIGESFYREISAVG